MAGLISAVLVFGVLVFFRDELVVEPEGLTLKSMFRSTRWNWSNLSNFRLRDLGAITFDAVERITYEDEPNFVEKSPPIVTEFLGIGWGGDAVDILEAARVRWATPDEHGT